MSATKNINAAKIKNIIRERTFTLEAPTASDDITIFRTDVDITVQEAIVVQTGNTPSTTFVLKWASDRSVAGTNLMNSTTFTNTTTGATAPLNIVAIPANSWVWIETSAASGTNVYLTIDIRYTED